MTTAGLELGEELRSGAVDEVHRDPQLAVELAAIMDTDDVRVPQIRS
jgi:hypothetical protein